MVQSVIEAEVGLRGNIVSFRWLQVFALTVNSGRVSVRANKRSVGGV